VRTGLSARGPTPLVEHLPPPGAHGGDGVAVAAALGLEAVLDLSQSLNPVAPDLVAVTARHLEALRHYPDAARATVSLADAMGVDPEGLLLTNGGSEAIALVGAELGGTVREPDFGLYPRSGGPRWRSNPHNPSGRLAGAEERAGVWDEAFYPLAAGSWTRGDHDAVVVGSLTKLFACPGLRIGYVLGDSTLIERCRRRQPLWSVNALALSSLADLLDLVDLPSWTAAVATLRAQLVGLFDACGLQAHAAQANWVLVRSPVLREELAPLGVLVRDCASFGMPGWNRVAVPDERGLAVLDAALQQLDRKEAP